MSGSGEHRRAVWQRRLEANWDWLVENLTDLSSLSDHLISALVFSPHDADFVNRGGSDTTQRECNRRFLTRLLEKGPHAYEAFTEALHRNGCSFMVANLESTDLSEEHTIDLDTTGSVQSARETTSSLPRSPSGAEGPAPESRDVVQHVYYIDRPKQVFVGANNVSTLPAAEVQQATGVQGLCPVSMLVALLKEILYHCPRKREALYTLESKLCTRLSEVLSTRIVSFEENFEIPFRRFLEDHRETFEVATQGNELIVSRVAENLDKLIPAATSSDRSSGVTENPRNTRIREAPDRELTKQPRKEKAQKKEAAPPKKNAGKEKESLSIKPPPQPPAPPPCKKTSERGFIAGCLNREPSDTLIFKLSADAYKDDYVHFSIDLASLWNTPERERAFIILGVKPLLSPPHQVVGLRCGSSKAFYDKIFLRRVFDSVPTFTYRELMHNGKLVGVIEVEKSAGYISPCIVKSDKKRPKLMKNQLWVRKDGKSIALNGSDFSDAMVNRVYCWFMQSSDDGLSGRANSQHLVSDPPNTRTASQSPGSTNTTAVAGRPAAGLRNTCTSHETATNVAAEGREESAQSLPAAMAACKSSFTQGTPIGPENTSSPTESLETANVPELEGTLCATTKQDCATTKQETACGPTTLGSPANAKFAPGTPASSPDAAKSPECRTVGSADSHDAPASQLGEAEQQSSDLMKALDHFKRGHFVLLCGTLPNVAPNLDALSDAPWIAVFDFDVNSRETGLLAYLEEGLRKTRSTSVSTWMDPHTCVTERGTQWWSLRGRLDVPDSNLSDLTPLKWLQRVCDKVERLCVELARFSQDYTVLSILVLWPDSKEETKCMKKFLGKLLERIHVAPSILLWFVDSKANYADSFEVKSITEDSEDNVKLFHLGLEEFCAEVESTLGNAPTGIFQYQLPSEDNTPATITMEEAALLKQDFEVLYLQNPYNKEDLTAEDLQREGDNFFRGGSINWFARYDMRPNCFDIERGIARQITKHIQKVYVDGFRGGVVRLFHAPGSGGSTMSQRILFDLREVTPCVHVKQRSGSSTEEVAERLALLYERAHMPVVALLDGEDEQKLQQLRTLLRHCAVVFLHVKRYPHPINESRQCIESQSKFFLHGVVSRQESRNLVYQFGTRCNGAEGKLRALAALDKDVQQNQQKHQMFEYGLTVYDHEYQGVKAYVRGYLQIERMEGVGLEPWQKGLGYLSLVYYYAQASLPCQFIGTLMGQSAKRPLIVQDLPHRVRMLLVLDTNEGKSQCIRIMHYAIATEVLEQILNTSDNRSGDGKLSEDAKRNLKGLCIDFLDATMKGNTKSSLTAQNVMHILTKVFILRDTADVVDLEREARPKPPRFSQIMLDLDSQVPYNGRLEVLQKLCDVCPDNPNFKAHLGRFYSLCQPDEDEEAERNFKEAISLALESDRTMFEETKDQFNLDLMYVHHMYACFFQRRIKRRISSFQSRCSGDESAFQAKLCEIVADADKACHNFSLSRYHSPPSNQEAHPYFHEIDVRLDTCSFILHRFPGDAKPLIQMQQQFGAEYTFVKTSIFEIEDLINECYNIVLLDDDNLIQLQKRVQTFNVLFKDCVHQLQALADNDPLTTLRLKVSAKKLQYDRVGNVVFVEDPRMPPDVLEYVVETYEKIFDHESFYDTVKTKLELDYRDWILAIRHPNFLQDYTVEKVLDEVRRWRTSVHSPQSISIFYLFVLLSLLGFGTSTKLGHEACLLEAQSLKETMKKLSRTDQKARHPREWLGREESSGIRRLVSHSHILVKNHRVTGTASAKFAVCTGTVLGRPRKSSGYISLDLKDKSSKRSVKVFFVPARAGATGTFLKGVRVQFFLGFTQETGYEAYEVTPLKRLQCPACGIWVEIKTDQDSVLCHGRHAQEGICGTRVFRV